MLTRRLYKTRHIIHDWAGFYCNTFRPLSLPRFVEEVISIRDLFLQAFIFRRFNMPISVSFQFLAVLQQTTVHAVVMCLHKG